MLKNIGVLGLTGSTLIGSYFLCKQYYVQPQQTQKKDVVLVGYGYAGRIFYNNLDKSKFNVKVILGGNLTALQPHFLESLETNSRSKISHKIDETNDDFKIYDVVKSIDTESKIVTTANKKTDNDLNNAYNYDYLVLAIGHETNTFNVEGVDKYCHFFTSYDDLEKLRQISNSRKLKVAVIGASLAGLEIAGYLSDNHEVDVIEYATSILPTMKLSTQEAVYNLMQNKHGINFKLGTRLLKVAKSNSTEKKIVYTEVSGMMSNETEYDIVIWTAGVKPNCNMNRWLNTNKVNARLQLEGKTDVYAIGDCNNTMPKSGQSAKSQGKYLAEIFNSNFEKKDEYTYESLGTVIKLPHCVYVENKYYSGFAPRFVHDIVHYLNI